MSDKPPLKVLQIVDTLGMGGAETWLMEVLRRWSHTGEAQMDFALTSGNHGIFDDEAARLGAKLYYLRYSRRTLIRFARDFRNLLSDNRYDAIHNHQDYTSGWHFAIGGKALPPIRIAHVHNPSYQIRNNYGISHLRRLNSRLGKFLIRRYATHLAGTSRQLIGEYGFDEPAFACMPKAALHCGFEPRRFTGDPSQEGRNLRHSLGWPADSKILLFAGRIDQSIEFDHPQNHKHSGFAVAVAIEAARLDPRIRMVLAGKTSLATPLLESLIAGAGLADRIRFLGIRSDIAHLMLGCDLLLFPSRGEGLGMVTVEAQAAGLRVLASNAVPRECVVCPDLMRFLPVVSDPAPWAQEALSMLDLPRDVASANRAIQESHFSLSYSARALINLYSRGTLP
jgi:glycosyltransferase involved in cell wall biosynthesis